MIETNELQSVLGGSNETYVVEESTAHQAAKQDSACYRAIIPPVNRGKQFMGLKQRIHFLSPLNIKKCWSSRQDIDNAKASIDKTFTFNPMTSLAIGFTHQYNRSTTEITEANMSKHLSIRMISEQSKSSEDLKILVFWRNAHNQSNFEILWWNKS